MKRRLATGIGVDECFFEGSAAHRDQPSFPTRHSSDRGRAVETTAGVATASSGVAVSVHSRCSSSSMPCPVMALTADRKSTRLNSSHANISYAVFCLKKKTHPAPIHPLQYLACTTLLPC